MLTIMLMFTAFQVYSQYALVNYTTIIIIAGVSCKSGSLLLENKILKICAFGQWHTLCGNTWTLAQVKVACRQLGRNPIGMVFKLMNIRLLGLLGARSSLVYSKDPTPLLSVYFH